MFEQNLNFIAITSAITAATSLAFIIYAWIARPFKRATFSFILFSSIMFVVSVSNFFVLYLNSDPAVLRWIYVLYISIALVHVAQLHLIADFIDFRYPFASLRRLRYLLYILPMVLIGFTAVTGDVGIEKTILGNMMSSQNLSLIIPFYITALNLACIIVLATEIPGRRKTNTSFSSIIILLAGILIYLLGQTLYQGFLMMDLVEKIPTNSISTIILYIFILVSLFTINRGIQNLLLKKAFENIHDCILITDSSGEIIEINECMKNKLGLNDFKGSKESVKKISNLFSGKCLKVVWKAEIFLAHLRIVH